jgi:hypothetical protein
LLQMTKPVLYRNDADLQAVCHSLKILAIIITELLSLLPMDH